MIFRDFLFFIKTKLREKGFLLNNCFTCVLVVLTSLMIKSGELIQLFFLFLFFHRSPGHSSTMSNCCGNCNVSHSQMI